MLESLRDDLEWLEPDGLGGFASGAASGVRTRRYQALLLTATSPPTGRMVLVNGVEAWVHGTGHAEALTSHRYAPGVLYPDGATRLVAFEADPWPRWVWRLRDGTEIEHEVFVPAGVPAVALSWRLRSAGEVAAPFPSGRSLRVRPLLSGRDAHALHHENPAFRFDAERSGGAVVWRPYDGIPSICAVANGTYRQAPDWYRHFLYAEERARGLDHTEDLASPGEFEFDLERGEAVLILSAGNAWDGGAEGLETLRRAARRRRAGFPSALERSGDAYIVRRGAGTTIVAGYPWFTDWGRDTFIALRGLCLATERFQVARSILLQWAGAVSEGMLPNRFVEQGEAPEYNAVDASLWYVIAVGEFLAAMDARSLPVPRRERDRLRDAVESILSGYEQGTRYRIHLDEDGLLAAGEPGVQLTWMDAKIGDWVVTPRIGKPVEVQALWLNALGFQDPSGRWARLFEKGLASFRGRFWDPDRGSLHDVVDVDHVRGTRDAAFRPNQIFAAGGLPLQLLDDRKARSVVENVERRLWTPLGLRSLAPGEPGYAPRYAGGVLERDSAYHQGTVWPWLLGPFVEGWLRVRGGTAEARAEARERFLAPIERHLHDAGLGHVSEVADAEPPHTPGGCPFQAWSVSEMIRLVRGPLREDRPESVTPPARRARATRLRS